MWIAHSVSYSICTLNTQFSRKRRDDRLNQQSYSRIDKPYILLSFFVLLQVVNAIEKYETNPNHCYPQRISAYGDSQ